MDAYIVSIISFIYLYSTFKTTHANQSAFQLTSYKVTKIECDDLGGRVVE